MKYYYNTCCNKTHTESNISDHPEKGKYELRYYPLQTDLGPFWDIQFHHILEDWIWRICKKEEQIPKGSYVKERLILVSFK